MNKISRAKYADMYGATVGDRIRLADTGKLVGTTCDLHPSLVRDLEERFGKENVVVK